MFCGCGCDGELTCQVLPRRARRDVRRRHHADVACCRSSGRLLDRCRASSYRKDATRSTACPGRQRLPRTGVLDFTKPLSPTSASLTSPTLQPAASMASWPALVVGRPRPGPRSPLRHRQGHGHSGSTRARGTGLVARRHPGAGGVGFGAQPRASRRLRDDLLRLGEVMSRTSGTTHGSRPDDTDRHNVPRSTSAPGPGAADDHALGHGVTRLRRDHPRGEARRVEQAGAASRDSSTTAGDLDPSRPRRRRGRLRGAGRPVLVAGCRRSGTRWRGAGRSGTGWRGPGPGQRQRGRVVELGDVRNRAAERAPRRPG